MAISDDGVPIPAGGGDNQWKTINAAVVNSGTSEEDLQNPLDVAGCNQILIAVTLDVGSATVVTLKPYFSDNAKAEWYQPSVLDITADSGVMLVSKKLSYNLGDADITTCLVIDNPGAQWMKLTVTSTTAVYTTMKVLALRGYSQWANISV